MLRVHEKYISASCNAYPLCCDLKNNFLCFGSSNAVAVCNFKVSIFSKCMYNFEFRLHELMLNKIAIIF